MKRILLGVGAAVLSSVTLWAAPRTVEPTRIVLNVPATEVQSFAGTSSDGSVWPSLGDAVTFTVTYPKSADKFGPRIQVLCYQNGELVYGQAGPYNGYFLLGGAMSDWYLNDGPATCRADLFYWSYSGGQKFNLLASTEFEAGAR
jgi:hypothetical protein